jgi:hypothetical protein
VCGGGVHAWGRLAWGVGIDRIDRSSIHSWDRSRHAAAPFGRSADGPTNQINQPTNQPTNQPIDRSIHRSNKSTGQTTPPPRLPDICINHIQDKKPEARLAHLGLARLAAEEAVQVGALLVRAALRVRVCVGDRGCGGGCMRVSAFGICAAGALCVVSCCPHAWRRVVGGRRHPVSTTTTQAPISRSPSTRSIGAVIHSIYT